jgi:hypothetical protein
MHKHSFFERSSLGQKALLPILEQLWDFPISPSAEAQKPVSQDLKLNNLIKGSTTRAPIFTSSFL